MTKTALALQKNYLGKKNLSRGTSMFSTSIQKPPCLLQLGFTTNIFKKLQKPGNSTAEVTFYV